MAKVLGIIMAVAWSAVFYFAVAAIMALPIQVTWNVFAPHAFGAQPLEYWQAFAAHVFASCVCNARPFAGRRGNSRESD